MNDKSHVSLEQHVCLACGTASDTGAILLCKRLRACLELHAPTGVFVEPGVIEQLHR